MILRTSALGSPAIPFAAAGLIAGCETWYSVIGGTLPEPALPPLPGQPSEAEAKTQLLSQNVLPRCGHCSLNTGESCASSP